MNFWLKLRVWFKITVFSIVLAYLLIFTWQNVDYKVTIWYWFGKQQETPVLFLVPAVFLFGVVVTLLVRTIFRTVRQLQLLKRKKMEKEAAAIVARAATLRTRETATAPATTVSTSGTTSPQ